jgi:hypothetical protein
MINQDIIAQDLFYKIRSRFPKMEMGDDKGQPTFEATKGRFFDFDAVFEGQNLGTVSISINEPGSLKIYFSKNILEDVDEYVSKTWFNFLKEMRKFAMKRLMSFDTRDISKTNLDKRDYGYLAKKESVMNESMMKGTSRTSYKPLERTRLIIRHSKPVDESIPGARSRNIESLFIENAVGERFKYPFVHKAGAEAMQRHVANGGVPHDPMGQKIIEISEQIAQLNSFKHYVQHEDLMNTETNHIVGRATSRLAHLKETIKKLSRQHHYEAFKNQIESGMGNTDQSLIDEVTMEEYKDKFTVKNFKEDIAKVFPLLYRIMQEESELDLEEVAKMEDDEDATESYNETPEEVFENWATTLVETQLSPEDLDSLRDMLGEHFPVGVNGENVSSSLENMGLNIPDSAKQQLAQLAEAEGPDADATALVREILSKHEPKVYEMLGVEPAQVEGTEETEQQSQTENLEMTDDERKAANDYIRSVSAKIKSGEVSPEEIKKEFEYTLEMYGVADDKVVSAWERITGTGYQPTIKKKSVSDDDIEKELKGMKGDDEDDDASFIANLKSKAKAGSVKQDSTGFGAGLDEQGEEAGPSPKQIAEFIMGFYNRENGTFPLGETGVKIKVEKQFGEKAGQLAERLIQQMAGHRQQREVFEELRVLSGLVEASKSKLAKTDYDKDGKVETGEEEFKGSRDNAIKKAMAKDKTDESFEFTDIKRLAGLK